MAQDGGQFFVGWRIHDDDVDGDGDDEDDDYDDSDDDINDPKIFF